MRTFHPKKRGYSQVISNFDFSFDLYNFYVLVKTFSSFFSKQNEYHVSFRSVADADFGCPLGQLSLVFLRQINPGH